MVFNNPIILLHTRTEITNYYSVWCFYSDFSDRFGFHRFTGLLDASMQVVIDQPDVT